MDGEQAAGALSGGEDEISWQEEQKQQRQQERRHGTLWLLTKASLISLPTSQKAASLRVEVGLSEMKRPRLKGCLQIFVDFLTENRLRLQILKLASPISSVMDGAVSEERLNLASLGMQEFHGATCRNTPGEAGEAATTTQVCLLLLTGTCHHIGACHCTGRNNLGFKGKGVLPTSRCSKHVPAWPTDYRKPSPKHTFAQCPDGILLHM